MFGPSVRSAGRRILERALPQGVAARRKMELDRRVWRVT
jgi:hypothetical protein